tara:strand:- start:312 stop:458 length:147 start_codon:yes stop_codon:yes gene_type:complete
MIIKALILSTMLSSDPAIIAMPPEIKTEAGRRRGKHGRGKRRGGGGLR